MFCKFLGVSEDQLEAIKTILSKLNCAGLKFLKTVIKSDSLSVKNFHVMSFSATNNLPDREVSSIGRIVRGSNGHDLTI